MIISRTPLRISFAGGGTDLAAYYEKEPGAVTSTAIDKYIYIMVSERFEKGMQLNYSKTELVKNHDDIKHPLFREALKMTGVNNVEISAMADIPSRGSGLGSSSTFTVGLLNALYAFQEKHVNAERLAKEASEIEIEKVGEPIGKQDQYIAAYGGLQHIEFNQDETVTINPVICKNGTKTELHENSLLFFTGITRKANTILSEQRENTNKEDKFAALTKMRDLSRDLSKALQANDLTRFGELLHQGWEYKKELADGISTPDIDALYEKARAAGALGGKISGAGGGGFLLLYVEKEKQEKVREALKLQELPFAFEPHGSKIIFVD